MHSHPNARLTQKGRLRLVTQHLEQGRSIRELAAENGISLRCAYRWLARYRAGSPSSVADRRSVRRTMPIFRAPELARKLWGHFGTVLSVL